jgi:GNAT superfamily N-acetyltransferase
MRLDDIDAAMRLKQAAGWNQTEQDWANVMALEPEGCWVWEQDALVVGSTTAICYGQELAWIGMVLVLPEHRGKGIARRLMEHALEWLEGRRVKQVKLDATDMGRPLYEKLGFRVERPIERWGAPGSGAGGAAGAELPLGPIAEMDREGFGVDRTPLVARLLQVFRAGAWRPEGFCLGRPGSNAYFLGPCSAADAATAGRLVRQVIEAAGAAAYFWDLFPDVPGALELAQSLGFERKRALIRMALRPEGVLPGRPERVFGAAGFEYG